MATSNTFYGYVYKTTNTLNGRIYIGQHKNPIHNLKYLGSGKLIKYAISKYGKENFTNEVICWCENVEEMDEKETFYIEIYSRFFDIYNIAKGGEGGDLLKYASPEKKARAIEKMMATRKRRGLPSGVGRGEANPMYRSGELGFHPLLGTTVPQETRDKISKSLMGNVPWNKGMKFSSSKKEITYEEKYLANKCKKPIKTIDIYSGEVRYYESRSACEKCFEGVKYRLKQGKVLEGETILFQYVSKDEYLQHRREGEKIWPDRGFQQL